MLKEIVFENIGQIWVCARFYKNKKNKWDIIPFFFG